MSLPESQPDPIIADASLLRRLSSRLEIDRAVFYVLLTRGWQLLAGPVTVLLIVRYFSSEMQGYFYTFASVLALQAFVELCMHIVIINVASHEWHRLRLTETGSIEGDTDALSRLASLARFTTAWYALVAAVFVIVVGLAGVGLFSDETSMVNWLPPWLALVVLTGGLLWTLPLTSVLEGCNQVGTVNRFRLFQAVSGHAVVWGFIAAGFGLWATVASAAVRLLWELYLIVVRYGRFFASIRAATAGPRMRWRTEIWPLQWRLAVHTAFAYFGFYFLTPVMFEYHGDVVAGQTGMTWTILSTLQFGALAWVNTRSPRFGMLVAQRNFAELDQLFFRVSRIAVGALIASAGSFCALLYVINQFDLHLFGVALAERFLNPMTTLVLALALTLHQLAHCQLLYVRAHKQEPFLLASVVSNALLGGAIFLVGRSAWGPLGAAIGYLAVMALVMIPWYTVIWLRFHSIWHRAGISSSSQIV